MDVLPFAFLLAFQAARNSSFMSAAITGPGGNRKTTYQILQAQGVANIACGCLGALPVTTNSALSLMAARHGPGPRLPAVSGLMVVAAAIAASALLGLLPLAAFAGVLIVSGARMIDPRIWQLLRSLYAVRRRVDTAMNLLVIATVASLLLAERVVAGIAAGILLELAHLALRAVYLQRTGGFDSMQLQDTAMHDAGLRERGIEILRIDGLLFFGNVPNLAKRLAQLPVNTRHLVLDFSSATHVDLTAVHTLGRELQELAVNGVQTRFSGIRPGKGPLGHLAGAEPLMTGRPCFENLQGAVESLWPMARQPREAELAA